MVRIKREARRVLLLLLYSESYKNAIGNGHFCVLTFIFLLSAPAPRHLPKGEGYAAPPPTRGFAAQS